MEKEMMMEGVGSEKERKGEEGEREGEGEEGIEGE